MAVETATQAYKRNTDQIAVHVQELLARLKTHADKQEADPRNWGFAGSLGHVSELLSELLDGFQG